jgi:hypothetical protein
MTVEAQRLIPIIKKRKKKTKKRRRISDAAADRISGGVSALMLARRRATDFFSAARCRLFGGASGSILWFVCCTGKYCPKLYGLIFR